VTDPSSAAGGWALRPVPPPPRSIVALLLDGTLDAHLAATLWLLVERRVPLIVASTEVGAEASTLLEALLGFLSPDVTRHDLAGSDEAFEWLPQASELGWPGTWVMGDAAPAHPAGTMLVASALSDHLPAYTWGERARIAVRATAIGYGLAATIEADSLDEVLDSLGRPPVSLAADELSYLGCVLILRRVEGGRGRVVAAHYIRPFVRDTHGHTQRLGPAVLATWDAPRDVFEDFSWGITPELAFRTGTRPGDFEVDVDRRTELLARLAATGVTGIEAVRAALLADHAGR
jgi:hypothetical protein